MRVDYNLRCRWFFLSIKFLNFRSHPVFNDQTLDSKLPRCLPLGWEDPSGGVTQEVRPEGNEGVTHRGSRARLFGQRGEPQQQPCGVCERQQSTEGQGPGHISRWPLQRRGQQRDSQHGGHPALRKDNVLRTWRSLCCPQFALMLVL